MEGGGKRDRSRKITFGSTGSGYIFGRIPGKYFLAVFLAIMLGVVVAFVANLAGAAPWTCLWLGAIPAPAVIAWLALFHIGKQPGYQNDVMESLVFGGDWEWTGSKYQPNPHALAAEAAKAEDEMDKRSGAPL